MTFLASWPSSTRIPAGCEAYETEAQALVKARHMTAAGVARVVVFEVSDDQIERHCNDQD